MHRPAIFGTVILLTLMVVRSSSSEPKIEMTVPKKEVEETVRTFFSAMSKRDVQRIRKVVDEKLMAIEESDCLFASLVQRAFRGEL